MDEKDRPKGREIPLSIEDTMNWSESIRFVQDLIETGRSIADGKEHELAVEWANLTKLSQWKAHPAYKLFTGCISAAPRFTDITKPLYRGQAIERSLGMPTVKRVGLRPDDGSIVQNRFSLGRALYLADSELAVHRELRPASNKDLYLIRFFVPSTLNIVDLSDTIAGEFLNEAIARAEACKVPNRGAENYDFSQFLAGLIVDAGFDGLRSRGVQGDGTHHYKNVTILKQLDDWESWLEPGCMPVLFAPSPTIV